MGFSVKSEAGKIPIKCVNIFKQVEDKDNLFTDFLAIDLALVIRHK